MAMPVMYTDLAHCIFVSATQFAFSWPSWLQPKIVSSLCCNYWIRMVVIDPVINCNQCITQQFWHLHLNILLLHWTAMQLKILIMHHRLGNCIHVQCRGRQQHCGVSEEFLRSIWRLENLGDSNPNLDNIWWQTDGDTDTDSDTSQRCSGTQQLMIDEVPSDSSTLVSCIKKHPMNKKNAPRWIQWRAKHNGVTVTAGFFMRRRNHSSHP